MSKPLAVLNIEDSESDSKLIAHLLKKAGYKITFERVETSAQMHTALKKRVWDIVISECDLLKFDVHAALTLLQEMGLDIPLIVVSGTVGEETAVSMMKAGAHDYLMKDNLTRLAAVIERELEQTEMRRERRQVEQKLHDSEELFHELADNIEEVFWITEPASKKDQYISPVYKKIWGRFLKDVDDFVESVLPEDRTVVLDAIEKQKRGEKTKIEYRIGHTDGSVHWVWDRAFPIFDASGKVKSVAGIATDITERKWGEGALWESEQKYRSLYAMAERREQERALFDNVRTALAHELDLTTILRTVVEAITKTFGYTLVSLYLLRDETLVLQHQIGYSQVINEIPITQGITGRVVRSGLPLLIEDVHVDQTFVGVIDNIVSEVCVPLFYEDQIIGVLNVESTQNKKLSEADLNLMIALSQHISPAIGRARLYTEISENEKRFRVLIENSADAITLINAQGIAIYDSPAAPGMLGYDPGERIGQSIFELVHADDLHETRELLKKLVGATARVHSTFRLRHKNNSWLWIEAVATNLLDEPSVKAIVVNYRNITERKQAEAMRREDAERLKVALAPIDMAVFNQDTDLRYTWMYQPQLGYTTDQVVGKTDADLLPPEGACKVAEIKRWVLENRTGTRSEVEIALNDRKIYYDLVIEPLRDANGEVVGITGASLDITERKQMEIALQRAEENYRNIFENSLNGIFQSTPEGRYIMVNPALARIWGYDSPEDLLTSVTDTARQVYVDPNLRAKHTHLLKEQGGNIIGFEYQTYRKDGSTVWVSESVRSVMDSNGSLLYYEGAVEDISERKQAEEKLRTSEERFSQLANNIQEAFWMVDVERNEQIYLSPAAETIWGRTVKELAKTTTTFVETVLPEDRDSVTSILAKQRLGEKTEMEYRIQQPDGSIHWVWDRAFPILDDSGRVKTLTGITADITERKQMEIALARSEQVHRTLFENVPVGLYRTAADGRILDANPALVNMFGFQDQTSLMKVNAIDLYADPATDRTFVNEINKSDSIINFETKFRRRDGTTFYAEDNIHVIRDEHGNPLFYEGSLIDITERKQAEMELHKSEERLKQAIHIAKLGIWDWDIAFDKVSWYGDMFQIYGITPQEFTGKGEDYINFTRPDYREEQRENIKRAFENGITETELLEGIDIKPDLKELCIVRPDGSECFTVGDAIAIVDKNGIPVRMLGITQDITERKLAEEKLYLQNAALEAAANTIVITDKDGLIEWTNPSFTELTGYDVAEARGKNPRELSKSGKQDQAFYKNLWDTILSGRVWHGELVNRRKDGSHYFEEMTITPLRNQQGEISRFIAVKHDITERKQAEAAAHESEARYRSLFEDSPVSLWEEDFSAVKLQLDALRDEGIEDFRAYFASHPQTVLECIALVKIVDVNKATLNLFGANAKADLLQNLSQIIDDDSAQLFQNELISIAQGKSHFEWEGVNQTLDGRKIIVRLNLSAMPGYEDSMSKVIISMVDITAHMHAEKAVRESERSLRESQMIAGLGSYVIDISSEIWTSTDILNRIFGIDESYTRSVESWTALIHPDWRQEMSDYFANEVSGNHIRFDKEYKIVRKNDGAERWVHGLGELEFDSHNQPVKMRGTIQDITERKQAEEALEQRARELQTLYETSMDVNSQASLDTLLSSIVERAASLLDTSSGGLYLMEPHGQSLKLVVGHNLPKEFIGAELMLGEGLSGQVAQSGKPIMLEDYQTWPDRAGIYKNIVFRRVLGVPLKVEDKVIGVLNVSDYERTGLFSEDQVRLVSLFADQAALAIDHARLYEQEYARRRELDTLYDSAMTISSNLSLEVVLKTVAEQMTKAINTDGCALSFRDREQNSVVTMVDFRLVSPEGSDPPGKIYSLKDYPATRHTLETREPLLLSRSDPQIDQAELALMNEQGTNMVLLLPLVVRDQIIGLMEVYEIENKERIFTTDEIRLAHSLSVQTAIFIENARLYQSAQLELAERKRVEESLRKSEQRYRALFEDMPISIWEEDFSDVKKHLDSLKAQGVTDFRAYFKHNPETFLECATMIKVLDVNQATLKMYHASSKEDLYKRMDNGLSESEVEHICDVLIAISEGKNTHNWEGIDETATGKPIEVSLNWTVAPGHENDFSKVIVTTIDITERKRAEESLRTSEEKYRLIIENAGEALYVVQNGLIVFVNPMFEKIANLPASELIGRSIMEFVPAQEDRMAAMKSHLHLMRGKIANSHRELKVRLRSGVERWIDVNEVRTTWEGELAALTFATDITERKLTEEALRTSEAQFRAIFEGAAIGIALVDTSGYPVKNNSALQEMLGYDAQELHSMAFTDFTHPDDVVTDWSLWQELIAGLRDHYQIEKRFIHKSGRIIWGKLTTSSVKPGTDGKILFGVGMVEDITDRKLREREQEALASITQALNQGLDLDVLLQNLLDAALHAIPLAEKGTILLLDAEDTLRIRALNGYLDPRVRTASFPSASGYSARAVRERQPLIIADARADASARYEEYEIEEIGTIQSAIVAPLMVKGIAIGAIALDNASRKEAFGEGELTTLSTFASSAALVIQNTRLLDETRQRVTELELLYESGLAISQLLSPKEIGQKIIELLEQKMNWHHTAIRLYNAEDETLELLAFHQPGIKSDAERLAAEARFKAMVSRSSQGLSGWVVQHGETVRTGNIINDDRYTETFAGLHSGLYIPIKTGERIIGVISIESEEENAFSKSDEQLTTILATQAANIFENARLYEEITQRAAELEQRVTERTAQIEATKRRLELATHAGQIGVWEYNPRENKVIWDERMHMIHQIPVGEFDGTSEAWAKLIHPNDLEISQLNKQLAVTKNLLLNDEHRILWPDGSVRHILTSAVMAYSPEGIPDRIIGINMDITERKQIEQSLRESEAYARLLFDAVPTPVSVTEANGLIVDVNKVFENQYGLVRDEIRGRRISEINIYPESELDKRDDYLSKILQGQPADPVELEFYVPGDRVHTLELHSYLITVKGRRLVLNTSHDITVYKKAEEIQRLAKSEMERALRVKNEFLANMSHELRTPLNSILGISESLEEQIIGALNEKQLKYIGIVRESGRHLLELINDILDLSKIEAGRMELDIHHISVEKFCQSSLRMVKELALKKSLNVSYKVNGEVKIILGDERRLKQALVNLLSNAVKFTPVGSRIGLEVNGHPETNEVAFIVWDQGVGIAQEDIQHLFKPFVQLDAGLTREYQGTGLGLALVAQMVHLHGGRVSVESEVGKGSRFIITLPWSSKEQKPMAKVTAKLLFPSQRSGEKRNGRILLVEDTDVVVQLVSEYLRYKGYEVILAHNGVEGVNLAAQEHPDLILMDVMMPIMDGLEATQNIRKDKTLQSIPIIALTALAMSGDSERCLAAGMNDYLSKPIQMQDLSDMIEKYMRPDREESNEQ